MRAFSNGIKSRCLILGIIVVGFISIGIERPLAGIGRLNPSWNDTKSAYMFGSIKLFIDKFAVQDIININITRWVEPNFFRKEITSSGQGLYASNSVGTFVVVGDISSDTSPYYTKYTGFYYGWRTSNIEEMKLNFPSISNVDWPITYGRALEKKPRTLQFSKGLLGSTCGYMRRICVSASSSVGPDEDNPLEYRHDSKEASKPSKHLSVVSDSLGRDILYAFFSGAAFGFMIWGLIWLAKI